MYESSIEVIGTLGDAAATRREFLRGTAGAVLAGSLWSLSPRTSFGQNAASKRLIARTEKPYNAEPALAELVENYVTPWASFFVRSHGAVPKVDVAAHRVRIEGLVDRPAEFSVAELKSRFPKASTPATLTCAGNRRDEFAALGVKIAGVQWNAGAIGHADWSGVSLADVLKFVGLKSDARHVWFEGLDPIDDPVTKTSPLFGGSIPLERALTDNAAARTLLATEMNGQPLTAEHGAPVRSLIPGFIGARSVKWLSRIIVSDKPSTNRFLAREYKLLKQDSADEVASAAPIYEMALNSAIATPRAGAALQGDRVTLRGFALPGGGLGRAVERVEVSADNGQTWTAAQIVSPRRELCWVLWSAEVRLVAGPNTLVVRAIDNRGDGQPQQTNVNVKGYQLNSWHKVAVTRS